MAAETMKFKTNKQTNKQAKKKTEQKKKLI